ncbi:11604_t:CDS:2 [Dentiscutata erythropus]|uniref:11604_t:CDS:1 n=1 Tax=Dentiscutata erythropus TaxID=1348616 RepID=A0A9N9D617_9GLOM|nr:11604_t:CDS:2 [Dentiscutata erythropus]
MINCLTTALILQRNGFLVEILSEYWPGDLNINYSNPCAAAAWRASLYIEDERNPETGLMCVQIYDFMDKKPDFGSDIWFKDFFRVIPLEELTSGVEYGVSYVTGSQLIYIQISAFMQITHFECLLIIVSLNVQKYQQWLLDQFIASGGKRKKVHLNESFFNDDEIDMVVNCTGVNARTFSGVMDNTVLPSRGQTISVWAPHIKTVHILTKDKSLQIIRHNVGRRPYRKNGIRVEVEITKNATYKDVIICHNYGHHFYGNAFKNTKDWDSCLEAFKLIEENIQRNI